MADEPLAEKPLDKKPVPRKADATGNPPPYLGLLLVVVVAIALAIAYGNYRSNSETAVQPAAANPQ